MRGLSVENVSVRYGDRQVVDDVTLRIEEGCAVGLVGESGSGKSTLARAICGLVPISAGRILFSGTPRARASGSDVQLVFQNPAASLNARRSIRRSVAEAVERRIPDRRRRDEAVAYYLDLVGLDPGLAERLPGQLSGGQKQRVAIARALAAEPAVLVADEITSALDVSVQAAILNLMSDLRLRLGLTILFISHNLAAVRYLCDTTAVMLAGRIVETNASVDLIHAPNHAYTRSLVAAVPSLSPAVSQDTCS